MFNYIEKQNVFIQIFIIINVMHFTKLTLFFTFLDKNNQHMYSYNKLFCTIDIWKSIARGLSKVTQKEKGG